MIAVEVIFFFCIAGIVAIVTMGKPLAEAYSERIKAKYRAIGSEEELTLRTRIDSLEQEVVDLRRQLTQIQETTEFTAKLIESKQGESLQTGQQKEDVR